MTAIKITTFDTTTTRAFANACEAAMKQLGADWGVDVRLHGKMTYAGATAVMSFHAAILDEAGRPKVSEGLKAMADRLNIDLTKTYDGYRITGYNARAPKNPWMLTRDNGRGAKAPLGWVRQYFAKSLPESPVVGEGMYKSAGKYDGKF